MLANAAAPTDLLRWGVGNRVQPQHLCRSDLLRLGGRQRSAAMVLGSPQSSELGGSVALANAAAPADLLRWGAGSRATSAP